MSDQLTPPGVQPTQAAGSPADPTRAYAPPSVPAYQSGPPAPGQYWGPPLASPHGFSQPTKRGNGLAITALVLGALALLVAIGTAAMLVGAASSGGPGGALSGQVTPVDKSVAGNDLQAELTKVLKDAGSSVDTLRCPDTSPVGQGLVTVCKGSVDGYDWTGIVVFEDAEGTFVLNEV